MPGILWTGLEQQRTDLRWLMLMAPPEVAVFILPTRACIRFRLMGPPMTWITGLLCISVMSCSDKEIKRLKEIQGLRVSICRDKEIERHKETQGLCSPFCSDKEIEKHKETRLACPISSMCSDKKKGTKKYRACASLLLFATNANEQKVRIVATVDAVVQGVAALAAVMDLADPRHSCRQA